MSTLEGNVCFEDADFPSRAVCASLSGAAGRIDSFCLQLHVADVGFCFRQQTDRHVALICLLFFMIKMIMSHESFRVT